ncbi:uncharacterized protein [Dysidea avara]|uniref:uncharacterized protein isoform X1 n=1 Tax=Dysidea avara TaxID=196820 RepID=UPI003324DBDD
MASFTTVEPLQLRNVTSTGRVIGKGAYGRVSEVYVHGTLCAAKEIHSILIEGVESEEFQHLKQSFLTECARNQALHHPNVVQMLGIHYPTREAILPWLVMEMMETSLARLLERCNKEKMPLYIKLSILVDISQGLEFLHGQDIIHRDLSSNNVLLTKHCVAKISDFGTAKLIMDHNRISKHTQTPGTLQFMPPEAISVNPRYGKSIDVFSLGCVSLHLMSHQWPQPLDQVRQDTLTALTEVERREEYLKLCSLSSLKQLIESCLHNEPGKRPDIATFRMKVKNIKADADRQAPLAITMNGLLNVGWQMNSHLSEVNSNGRVVGTGRYGRVLEVFVHGALYAAKEVDPHLFKSMTPEEFEATRTLFLMECATSQIHHPNVVQVLGIHYPTPEAKLPWLVMEMMEFSLTGFLEKYEKNEIPFHTKLSILVNISQGLEFLHGQDIIHRDLSSNNILLTKHCVAKIADLGVTKVVKSQTIHFLPPEAICYFTVQYGKPVDVFSFACITLHVLSHQWPEPSEQSAEDSMTAATEIQKREKYLRFFTQLSLRKLVESCLHSKPDQRPDIADVCRGLVNIKTANGRQLPLATANSIELYNAGWQKHLHLSEVISTGKVIGTGAYGWVLEVRACGTVCAAKEIDPYLVESISSEECEVVKKSFLECVNTSRIHHPNVVQVLGIHYPTPEAKLPWLVMEMMGSSLTGFLEKYEKDKVPLHIKLSILVDVSQGLEFLHCQSITHGNLSSNNVLLTKQQLVAKIADLGLAKVVRNSALKLPMEALGILHFTAPEALPVPEYSKPVDVFSLGCIACHVMSHQWPEPKDLEASLTALTEAERREEYLQSCTQSSLKHLVRSCLHNEPNQRPKVSAARVGLEHLRNVTADQFPLATTNYIELLNVIKLDNVRVDMLHSDLVDARTNLSSAGTVIKQMAEMIAEKEEKMQQTEHERKQRSFSENVITSIPRSPLTKKSETKKSMTTSDGDVQFNDVFTHTHPAKKLHTTQKRSGSSSISQISDSYSQQHSNSGINSSCAQDQNFTHSLTLPSDSTTAMSTTSTAAKFWQIPRSFSNPFTSDKRSPRKGRKNQQTLPSDISTDTFQLWSCANCMQINEADVITCGRCKMSCGSTAVGQCFCNVCKLKMFVPASTEILANTVCPCCEKALHMVAISS